ncbi:hypothetical protein PH213_42220 [Streptomyces sp. SRF1]|uniref:hypothetical protein n=1 Tax=Streptomyces sp. SRF1 TaxID=1549642 RepID=UPI0025B18C77|nr:hypothetical protein [Streptomyces sp. SRF1]MDN3061006.1 hypothetical protein [Streptomyces sp. SRF1]
MAGEQGLREMIRRGQPITFRGLAQTADVSLDPRSPARHAPTCAEYETAITLTGFLRKIGNPATGSWDDEGAGGDGDSVVECPRPEPSDAQGRREVRG